LRFLVPAIRLMVILSLAFSLPDEAPFLVPFILFSNWISVAGTRASHPTPTRTPKKEAPVDTG
jgi:hypothetical protein